MRRAGQALRIVKVLAVMLYIGSLVQAPAMAATVTYAFTGLVTHVGRDVASLPPLYGTSSQMSGSVSVYTNDVDPRGFSGLYPIENLQVTIGKYHASAGPFGATLASTSGTVGIGLNSDSHDFQLAVVDLKGSPVNGLPVNAFFISLAGPTTLFDTDALPGPSELPPTIASFSINNQWGISFRIPSQSIDDEIHGRITSLTAVPLPASVILFGAGLVGLIGLGAGRFRAFRLPHS